MSGHSKWKNIMHRKGKSDAQRAKVFTKIGREIAVAIRASGPDPVSNSGLRDAIAKAKANNVPNENVDRMIKKYSGADNNVNFETIIYEGYGPSGVAVIVETMTDNRNRTAGEMRHYFDKNGGNLGQLNCVSFMFSKKGMIVMEKDGINEDELMMTAIEAGAEDFAAEEDVFEIYTEPEDLSEVRSGLEQKGYSFLSAQVEMIPSTYTRLDSEDDLKKMSKLIEMLEDNDDVQNVWHNLENEDDLE